MDLKQTLKDFNMNHGVYATIDQGPQTKTPMLIMCKCNDWISRPLEGEVDIKALLEDMYKELKDVIIDG